MDQTTEWIETSTSFVTPQLNNAADKVIGSILILFMVIAIPGNILALIYFWPRRCKTVHDMLYTLIIATDVSTCVSTFPVVLVFLDDRMPSVFETAGVCSSWTIVFGILMRYSMFVVVMISVSRTIAITFPYHTIRAPIVLTICFLYAAWLIAKDITFICLGLWKFEFYKLTGYCVRGPSGDNVNYKQFDVYFYLLQVEFIVPFLVILISFIVSVTTLLTRSSYKRTRDKKFWQVSITITLFSAVFMVCNVPVMAHNVFQALALHFENIITFAIMKNSFFYWYRFVMSFVFCTVLNSTMNPVLYLLRMPQYRKWLFSLPWKKDKGVLQWSSLPDAINHENGNNKSKDMTLWERKHTADTKI